MRHLTSRQVRQQAFRMKINHRRRRYFIRQSNAKQNVTCTITMAGDAKDHKSAKSATRYTRRLETIKEESCSMQ